MPGATRYPPEFKREAVRLVVRSSPDKSVAQIVKELGLSDRDNSTPVSTARNMKAGVVAV